MGRKPTRPPEWWMELCNNDEEKARKEYKAHRARLR